MLFSCIISCAKHCLRYTITPTCFTQSQTPVFTIYLHGYKHVHCSTQAHTEFQIRNMFWHTCANVICDVLPFIVTSLLSLSRSFQCCLVESFTWKGQNVTTDYFFTTVKLAENLKAKNKRLVGTVNRIRREISQSVKQFRKDRYSTTILKITCLHSEFTNASLQKMSVLSTLHRTVAIGNEPKKVSETVHYYNSRKYGVDIVDQMARKYSTKAGSRRWPVLVFFTTRWICSSTINKEAIIIPQEKIMKVMMTSKLQQYQRKGSARSRNANVTKFQINVTNASWLFVGNAQTRHIKKWFAVFVRKSIQNQNHVKDNRINHFIRKL